MSMMLSEGDINFMKDSIRDIINQFHTTITFLNPLPVASQNNYNPVFHEFIGSASYETVVMPAERKDIVNNYSNDLVSNYDQFGENDDGRYLYAIPNIRTVVNDGIESVVNWKPHNEAVVIIDGSPDRYEIVSMRDRIGETLVEIRRYTGAVPKGSETIDPSVIPHDGFAEN